MYRVHVIKIVSVSLHFGHYFCFANSELFYEVLSHSKFLTISGKIRS